MRVETPKGQQSPPPREVAEHTSRHHAASSIHGTGARTSCRLHQRVHRRVGVHSANLASRIGFIVVSRTANPGCERPVLFSGCRRCATTVTFGCGAKQTSQQLLLALRTSLHPRIRALPRWSLKTRLVAAGPRSRAERWLSYDSGVDLAVSMTSSTCIRQCAHVFQAFP